MPRVFITQLPSRMEGGGWVPTVDVTPAKEHGDLLFMIPPGMNQPTGQGTIEQLRSKLRDFGAEDFLLPMGDPILMVAASAMLGARGEMFKVLKWDRQTRRYQVYVVHVDQQPERNT